MHLITIGPSADGVLRGYPCTEYKYENGTSGTPCGLPERHFTPFFVLYDIANFAWGPDLHTRDNRRLKAQGKMQPNVETWKLPFVPPLINTRHPDPIVQLQFIED